MNENESVKYHVSIPKDELSRLPAESFQGEIVVVDSSELVEDAVNELLKETIIGFDTETKPNFKKGCHNRVALLQLSTYTKCFLFRLCKIGLPQPLQDFLQNEKITKIGLSIHDDFHNLKLLAPSVKPAGFIDLQPFVKQFLISDNSLSRIHGILFGKRISKSQQLSNWEAPDLKPNQCMYAALDAYACLHIYSYLNHNGFKPEASKYYKQLLLPSPPAETKNINP
ncbi:MAG: 3'-5' exonuclease domain-containing protein 2 [Muribaculaceae bacterium]|nr:3'-5' exonuclease domain-containing protein 2 [Muribaculaceae bacterium]